MVEDNSDVSSRDLVDLQFRGEFFSGRDVRDRPILDVVDLESLGVYTGSYGHYLSQLCERLTLDYASYATLNTSEGLLQGCATYPLGWKRAYIRRELYLIDPVLHRAALAVAPVDWDRLPRDENFHRVFAAAAEFGITTQGLTVPVRGPHGDRGVLSVTRDCPPQEWQQLKRRIIGDLQTAALRLHDHVMRNHVLSDALLRPNLSARETEILQWVAAGKQQQDIGAILAISPRTVEV
ncbi:hypothetical protein FGG78_29835, partial [Thioclava sp. BHET1]